mgnify:CR=1 FL=1
MMHKLLYRIAPHNGGVVFAEEGRALEIARLHNALRIASTWGEFKTLIPAKEYSAIVRRSFDDLGERRPRSTDGFNAEQICGWSDGDYPPWLQAEMHVCLDTDTLSRFAEERSTAINGKYWHIDPGVLPELLGHLRSAGVRTKRAEALPFH